MQTQKEKVKAQLNAQGYVTRNWALQNYITRLGAIMCDLKKEGISFTGDFEKHSGIQDYYYRLKPLERQIDPNKATICPPQKPFETSDELLNEALTKILNILKGVNNKDAWKNAREITQLTNAIAGDNINKKKGLINHYKK